MTGWELLVVAGMAIVTFSVRVPVLALVSRISLPPALLAALKYVPPAVLAAIVTPALLAPQGDIRLSPSNPYLVAGLIAAWVAWRTQQLLLTIILGMVSFWLWRLLLAGLAAA